MSNIAYYILDVESTGLKAGWHEVIQVSIIRVSDKEQITKNIRAEYPKRANPKALEITGKTYNDLKNGVSKTDAINDIEEFFLEDEKNAIQRCIVAHNASFDQRMCHATWESENKIFPAHMWLCTKEFTRKYAKKQGLQKIAEIQGQPKAKFDLASCMKACGLTPKFGAHNAVVDTLNTLDLFNFLMEQNLGHASVMKNKPHE